MKPEKMVRLRTAVDRQDVLSQSSLNKSRPSFKSIYESYAAYNRYYDLLMKKEG
jgi:hypothetical protein